ncbi:MAG: hypothetical protein QXK93_01265 [Candidatus Bathyarchaeia archaeon]|nr:hypothetical protein [Candidatus Bathyarchaeota archaeon]
MEISERRVIGALLLLLGVSMFAAGLYHGELKIVIELLKKVFSAWGV